VGLLLNGAKTLVAQDMGKAEILNAFLASVFGSKTSLQKSQVLERGRSGIRKTYPWWKRIRLENTQANLTYRSL